MKHLLSLCICFLLAFTCLAQSASFFANKWKIKEVKTVYAGGTMSVFHRDSTKNKIDYAPYEIKFAKDGSYSGTSQSGTPYKGSWSINSTLDTVLIDRLAYQVVMLNSDYFTTRTYTLHLADTLGHLDTVHTDFTMYSVPDVVTSLDGSSRSTSVMEVFPNPSKEKLEAVFGDAFIGHIKALRLRNTVGQTLQEIQCDKRSASVLVEVSDLHPGVYMLEVLDENGNRIAVQKVVKE